MFEHSDYLREQAAKYLEQAKKEEDSSAIKELLQLATICEEVANDMDEGRGADDYLTHRDIGYHAFGILCR
jgi:hypothetical protein